MDGGGSWQGCLALANPAADPQAAHISQQLQQFHTFPKIFVSPSDLSTESGYIHINISIEAYFTMLPKLNI